MGCQFMIHCKENAKSLSEPEWRSMITQLMKEPGGISLIQTLSKPYPGYKRAETQNKIMDALDTTGPHTCDYIKNFFNCGWNCSVSSPAGLAFRDGSDGIRGNYGSDGENMVAMVADGSGYGSAMVAPENDKNFRQIVRSWVEACVGKFTVHDLDRDLNLKTRTERTLRSKWLSDLVLNGIIERVRNERFTFRVRERELQEMQILEAETTEFPFKLPFALNAVIEINKKEIILVSGESNAGKTAVIFKMMWDNIRYLQEKEVLREKGVEDSDGIALRYFSSEMGPSGVRKKLESFGPSFPPSEFVRCILAVERSRDFHDVLDPDGINFIDYLEVFDGEYFKLSSQLTLIHNALAGGIAVVGLQKKVGSDIGRGGEATLEKPRLALALSENKVQHFFTVKIVKAKHYRDKNPVGLEKDFIIRRRGTDIIEVSDWGYAKDHQVRRNGRDYSDWN